VDESGEFIGGEDKLQEFATINFNMPKIADDLEISGTIFIQFVVERDGKITQLRAIAPKERQLGYGLEEECMRVIKLTSGKWKPAKRAGKAVRSYWRFPFEVDNSSSF
jgi:protein TonB